MEILAVSRELPSSRGRRRVALTLTFSMAGLVRSPMQVPWRIREARIKATDLQVGPMPISIFTLRNRSLSPGVQLFVRAAREVATALGAVFCPTNTGLTTKRTYARASRRQ